MGLCSLNAKPKWICNSPHLDAKPTLSDRISTGVYNLEIWYKMSFELCLTGFCEKII